MNITSKQRDLLFFVVLIFMVRVAWNLSRTSSQDTADNSISQQSTHISKAASQEEPRERYAKAKSFSIHEADPDVLARIKALQKQINETIELVQPSTLQAAELQSMKQRLFQLHRTYKHTSPAVALLGPIGYTGIVLKEQRAEKSVLEISNKLNRILHTLTRKEEQFVPIKALPESIQISQGMLERLAIEVTA